MSWTPFSGHTPENLIVVARGAADELDRGTADASRVKDILNELIRRYSAQLGAQAGAAAVRDRKPSDGPDFRTTAHYGQQPLDPQTGKASAAQYGQRAAQLLGGGTLAGAAAAQANPLTATAVAAHQRQYAEYMRSLLMNAEALAPPPITVALKPTQIGGVWVDEVSSGAEKTLLERAREWLRK